MKYTFCSLFFVVFLVHKGINATINQGPSNTVTEIGEQVKLNCTADATVGYWILSKDGTAAGELIIVSADCSKLNAPFVDHYALESLGGGTTCNLIVFNITMEQAGVYKCLQGTHVSASILTVVESAPVNTVNSTTAVVENESVISECSLKYNGSMPPAPTLRPYFYWTDFSGQNVSSSYDSTTENTAVSQITVKAARKNIESYSCHVYLKLEPAATGGYANNTLNITKNASSPTIEVLYGPSIPVIAIAYQILQIQGIPCEVGVLTCSSSGNPPPIYEWFDTKESVSILSNDATFDLAEVNRNYTCVANNTIRDDDYRELSFHVYTSETDVQDCKFPRNESTWINVTGCDNGTCSCSNGYDGLNFTCNTDSYPNASFEWIGADHGPIKSQVYINITINGQYRCTTYFTQSTSNYTGNVLFTNGSNENNVTECLDKHETTDHSPPPSPSPTIWDNSTNGDIPGEDGSDVAMPVAVAISVYEIVNLISMGFFLVFYNMDTDANTNGNNNKVASNKKAFNNRFPWLEKMLPCMNESPANGGKQCLWIFVFSLITISCGVFIFPILVIIVMCCGKDLHGSQENSHLNLRMDDVSVSMRGENRFRPPPSSLPSASPSSHVASVQRLPIGSAGSQRPPPPPNKPTRPPPPAMTHQINREGGAVEYAFLPLARRPHLAPAQYLDDDETSHYAILRRV